MPGSPIGIFNDLSLTELAALKASAISRITSGETISLSGAGKSKGKQWSMKADEVLREVNFSIAQLAGGAIRKTHFDASGQVSAS
ncbi:MAG: hypothetical protein WC069_06765 [Candidatus Shapirobacteria bacterium]